MPAYLAVRDAFLQRLNQSDSGLLMAEAESGDNSGVSASAAR